jgi:hypothetical protein
MKLKNILFCLALTAVVGFGPFDFIASVFSRPTIGTVPTPFSHSSATTAGWVDQEARTISLQANNIDQKVLRTSLRAYMTARHKGLDNKQMLTIIDYSKPSSEKRLWVVDLRTNRVLFNTYVSHGKNSGDLMATSFSNQPGSLKSSIGVFITDQSYIGNNGYSLRLSGLEHGINDNAFNRDIVVHGAWYATPDTARRYGQLGRSWGCPAVNEREATPLINTIKNSTLLVVYYPDRNWLNNSTFLAG